MDLKGFVNSFSIKITKNLLYNFLVFPRLLY